MKIQQSVAAFVAFLSQAFTGAHASDRATITFSTPVSPPQHQSKSIDYKIDPRTCKYFVYAPSGYRSSTPFGLVVYISPADDCQTIPDGWEAVLARNNLLFIVPQNAGNEVHFEKRCGMAVLGALEMMRNYNVDKNRVYAAGLSGGARTAGFLGTVQSDVFCGTIQSCGCDFYKEVPRVQAASDTDTNGNHYGVQPAEQDEINAAKSKTKFVLITGAGDFRRGNILDIYNGGYAAESFHAKLIDVPEMGHQDCDARTLEEALYFLR